METPNSIPGAPEIPKIEPNEDKAQKMADALEGTIKYLSQNKAVKVAAYIGGTVASLYLASYIFDAAAAAVTSYKKLDKACKQ
jgi:hypothetical protein